MKPCAFFWIWAAGLQVAVGVAEPGSVRERAWWEAVRVSLEEATAKTQAENAEAIAAKFPEVQAGVEVVEMEPVVVVRERPPEIKVPRETRVEELFRTGVIAERVGPKVTSRLWMKGDKGVMWSLSW